MQRSRAVGGFTLIEMMLVVAVIAIITAIAYPSYQDQLLKARRAEAKTALLKALQLEERFYTSNGTYTSDIGLLFGLAAGTVPRSGEDPTKGNYDISAGADPLNGNDLRQGVVLTAVPSGGFTDNICGNLSISSIGTRNFTNPQGKGSQAICW